MCQQVRDFLEPGFDFVRKPAQPAQVSNQYGFDLLATLRLHELSVFQFVSPDHVLEFLGAGQDGLDYHLSFIAYASHEILQPAMVLDYGDFRCRCDLGMGVVVVFVLTPIGESPI